MKKVLLVTVCYSIFTLIPNIRKKINKNEINEKKILKI